MKMARDLFRVMQSVNFANNISNNFVSLEHFKGQQLEDAITCSQKIASLKLLKEDDGSARLSVTDEETRRLGEATNSVVELLEEIKRAISGVKEMRQRVRCRKDNNLNVTREMFTALRKAIDEREEEMINDINERAYRRERALELQLERLVLLWTQLKNCLELMKNIAATKMRSEELTKRRMILEQRSDHLKEMKQRSRLEPVMSEQAEIQFDNIEQLFQAINKLGYIPLEPSKCEVVIPPVIVKKKTTLTIMLKNKNNDPVTDVSNELNVFIENIRDGKAVQVRAIKEVGGGRYEVSFTASRCGYHMISIIVDGHHIPGSPCKTPVDRDYNKMTEQDCSQVVTHYGENKFIRLHDVAVAPTGEVVIVDGGNRKVIILDDQLKLLSVIGQGSRLDSPYGVAVIDNVIAVSNYGSDQVKKYSLQGKLLSVIGGRGNKNGQFIYPRGLTFNNNQLLYVVNGGNHRVEVFNKDDTFAFSFGSRGNNPGQFQCPLRISIDPNNNVLVTDHNGNGILIFTHDGQFIHTINSNRPYAITISPTGYLITGHYVDDNKIRVWSPTYQLINQFGKKGSKQGKFSSINGMAMDYSGTIYVAEGGNKRLQIISNS